MILIFIILIIIIRLRIRLLRTIRITRQIIIIKRQLTAWARKLAEYVRFRSPSGEHISGRSPAKIRTPLASAHRIPENRISSGHRITATINTCVPKLPFRSMLTLPAWKAHFSHTISNSKLSTPSCKHATRTEILNNHTNQMSP